MRVVFLLEAMDFKVNSLSPIIIVLVKYTFSPSKVCFYKDLMLLVSVIICEDSFLSVYSVAYSSTVPSD